MYPRSIESVSGGVKMKPQCRACAGDIIEFDGRELLITNVLCDLAGWPAQIVAQCLTPMPQDQGPWWRIDANAVEFTIMTKH